MSDLVGNPEDRFSRVAARLLGEQILLYLSYQIHAYFGVTVSK